jgi:predicted transposase/invertase (TIGR01784 family)
MKKKTKLPINIGKYLDPLSDFGFKYLFGSDPNKELLIAFLNELFKGRKTILDLSYNKNESHGPQRSYRNSIYDLTCTGQDGEQFIIEVQRIFQQYFKDRALYYTSALIHDQGPKGQKKWDYKLKEIYLIGLMDFSFNDSQPLAYLHRIHLADEVTGEKFYEKLGYIFIEIPKFNKQENELETELDRWLYVLKNMSKLQKIPVFLSKRIFQKLFTLAEVSKLTKEEYMKYEKSLMAEWDEYAIMKTIEEKGMKQGIEKGIEKGEEKKSYEFVKNLLLQTDFSITKIASLCNVTEDFVENVKKTLE